MAITAAITVKTTTATKTAGCGCVTVSAEGSTLGAGLWDQHEWRWRITAYPTGYTFTTTDPRPGAQFGSTINLRDGDARGYSFMFPIPLAGTYTIELTAVDKDGATDTATTDVTVAANTGTVRYVNPSATGANNGTSQTDAWTDIDDGLAAMQTAGSDFTLLLAGDHDYEPTVLRAGPFSNCRLDWDGTGTVVPRYDLATVQSFAALMFAGENNTQANMILFNSGSGGTPKAVVGASPIDCLAENVRVVSDADNHSAFYEHTSVLGSRALFLNNSTENQCVKYSGIFGRFDYLSVYGCSFAKSGTESVIRIEETGASPQISHINLIGVRGEADDKNVFRIGSGAYVTGYRCATFTVGTGVPTAIIFHINADTCDRARMGRIYVQTEAGYCTGSQNGTTDVSEAIGFYSSIFIRDATTSNWAMINTPSSSTTGRARLLLCTLRSSRDGGTEPVFGGFSSAAGGLIENKGTLYLYTPPASTSAFLPNYWPTDGSTLDWEDCVFSGSGNTSDTTPYRLLSLANFNALAGVTDVVEAERTLDSNFLPDTLDATVVPDGVFEDYYGNPLTPGAACSVGAVQELPFSAPTVTTPTSASVATTTATLGGNITDDGGDTITERGIVYALTATNADPEIGGTGVTKVAASGTDTGVFTVGVTGLTAESGYSFKAYATNATGTGYTSADTFTTDALPTATPTFTTTADVDITDTIIDISTNRSTTPLSVQVRLHIADAALDTGDVVSSGASGKLAVATTVDSSGDTFVFGTDVIAEDDYITFNMTLDRSLAGVFPTDLDAPSGNILTLQLSSVTIKIGYNLTVTGGSSSGTTFVRRVLGRAAGRLRSFRPAAAANPMQFLWWDDFRVIYSDNERRMAFAAHPNAYAPLLTTTGLPSNEFTNAYLWSGATQKATLVGDDTFADTAAGTGQQYANAYLHTMRFLFNERLDGSIPFCPYPNGWGFAEAEGKSLTDRPSDDTRWIADRAANFERLGRHDDDLLTATYLTKTVDPLYRGCTGYAENGIAANYAWWLEFWAAAKSYIDTAVGHTRTPVEIYDDCEFMGPNLNHILSRINGSESTHRMFDVIKADARWSTELVNGYQTWEDFFNTLTTGQQDRLNDTTQTSLFTDGNTLIAEKLGVFRDTIHAYQIDQTMVKACREVFGSRFRFACEYGIEPSSETVGTIGDRSSNFLTGRIFENRGPHALPTGWGAAPISYQLFGLRSDATGGDLPTIADALGYTRTGSGVDYGEAGGAAADGRLFNIARLKENVRRIRSFGVRTVPWWNYIPANGVQTGIVTTVPMTTADHVALLDHWRNLGVDRFIIWGNPARDYPTLDYWESDFGIIIDEVLPNL